VWSAIGVLVITAIVSSFLSTNIVANPNVLREHPDLVIIPILGEIVAVGLLPVLFTILNRDDIALYGLGARRLGKSLLLSLLVAAVYYVALFGTEMSHISFGGLPGLSLSPLNLLYSILAVFAYGPLEVFFVVWLIYNTDRIFKTEAQIVSRGLIITVVVYGILHTFSAGIASLTIALRFLAFGLIYKYTKNSIGPMAGWTITNDFVWFLLGMLNL
jgi:hypothetical protein